MPCCLLLAVLLASVAQVVDPGFTKLQGDNTCSEEVLTFICVTAGRGATEVTLNNITVQDLEFSHSRYETGSAVNESSGDVSAGSLSRSQTQDCFDELANTSSYCYETVIKVRLTEQTRCRTIGCRTRFRLDGEDRLVYFGDAPVAREPPAPKNIRNTTQPAEAVTITWDPESGSCSNARYSVRTLNCGSCDDRSNSTPYTNITCSELVPEQQCHVSVQSILECGAPSDPATLMFIVSAVSPPKASTEGMVNVGAIVGGVIGSFFVILGVIIVIIGIIVWRRRQGHVDLHGIKRSDSEGALEDTSTTAFPDQGAKQEEEGHEDPPKVDNNQSIAEDTTLDNRVDQRLLASPVKNGQSPSTETAASNLQNEGAGTYTPQSSAESRMEEEEAAQGHEDPPNVDNKADQRLLTATEAMSLHQISSRGSTEETAADADKKPSIETESNLQNEDAKTYTPQSSAESRMKGAPESNQLTVTDFLKLVQDLFEEEIKNLETSREKQTPEIKDLKTSQEEHTQAIEKSNLKIGKLLAEARKNELTMGELTQRIEQLTKDLKAKERTHQEMEKLEQEHSTEKEMLKQEMQDLRKELKDERTKVLNLEAESQKLWEELEQERSTLEKIEQLKKDSAAEMAKEKLLECENKMPRKIVSTETNTLDARPGHQRTMGCPAQTQ